MIFEIPITLIDPETGETNEVTAVINHKTRETSHVPRYVGEVLAELREEEEEPDG